MMNTAFFISVAVAFVTQENTAATVFVPTPETAPNVYCPIEGGWEIRITDDWQTHALDPNEVFGVVRTDPRTHFRALFPPADRSLVWTEEQLEEMTYVVFRPYVLALNAPQFVFDAHTAGGRMGVLKIGVTAPDGRSKWLSDFSGVDHVRYVKGRLEYELTDADFPGMRVHLKAVALANAVGVLLRYEVEGAPDGLRLTAVYGGATAESHHWYRPSKGLTPASTKNNFISADSSGFVLRRPFSTEDGVMTDPNLPAAVKVLPDYEGVVRGGGFSGGEWGTLPGGSVEEKPADIFKTVQWAAEADASAEKPEAAAAGRSAPISSGQKEGYVVFGTGLNMDDIVRNPRKEYKAALDRNDSIAERVTARTPDPWFDSSLVMNAFNTEGIWDDRVFVHGSVSWRMPYAGWRIRFGQLNYGWTERVRQAIQLYCKHQVVKEGTNRGALKHLYAKECGVYYNMNEVFLNQVRYYYDYTDDVDLMREIWPVLTGIVEWESRRLQPENEHLYESALNTWISDSHWYIRGQCTQASAYMLQAHRFLADVAERIGENSTPYREKARLIRDAMQRKLWIPRKGVYAEYLDTRGHRMLHEQPELPTIYHSSEFGAAAPLQVAQMLRWADRNLRHLTTDGGGTTVYSSNWFPNDGRKFTHSTYELAFAESMNYAETNFMAGRTRQGYDLMRGCLAGIFNGPAPGGISCHQDEDGLQRLNYEFADGISLWGRLSCEGLFGIIPDRPAGRMTLRPQIPASWPEASIDCPMFHYKFAREPGRIHIAWRAPDKWRVQLRQSLGASKIKEVKVNGKPVDFQTEAGVGLTWVIAESPGSRKGRFEIIYDPLEYTEIISLNATQGETIQIDLPQYGADAWLDPQGLLADCILESGTLSAEVDATAGPGDLFLGIPNENAPSWLPLPMRIADANSSPPRRWNPPSVQKFDLNPWHLIDLSDVYNVNLVGANMRVYETAVPPEPPASTVGWTYWRAHWTNRWTKQTEDVLSDARWRGKIGENGIAWTDEGIPFKSPKEGSNLALTSLTGGFPARIEFPVNATGDVLYLMVSGQTWPTQSHVVNLRVTLRYTDGTLSVHDLVQPQDLSNSWLTLWAYWFDSPGAGFENIGGRDPKGAMSSANVEDLSQPVNTGDTTANLLAFDLAEAKTLASVEMETIANDVAWGLMGASILK
jgi:hypothetical protein